MGDFTHRVEIHVRYVALYMKNIIILKLQMMLFMID
jgi:hypothetical protein